MNPGGSVKDRVALRIVQEALASGALQRGGLITEGTVGSTGVSLALVAAAHGVRCFIAMPDDAAREKSDLLLALGALQACSDAVHSSVARGKSLAFCFPLVRAQL